MKISGLDKLLVSLAPAWGTARLKARALTERLSTLEAGGAREAKRHYEAASQTQRTSGWPTQSNFLDADLSLGLSLLWLRGHARDLIRNNGWARRAQRIVANNTVGWGIVPKASGPKASKAHTLWRKWAGSTDCAVEGRKNFYGIQHLVMRSLVESGEVLIQRRFRRVRGREINLELQVIESDYLDHTKLLLTSDSGGPIIRGVEFDQYMRRAGYWLFKNHPGSGRNAVPSSFVPAQDVLHIFEEERPGQTRGVSWLAAAIVPLKDLSDLEDAELVKQKIAACFAAFVTDSGPGDAMGEQSEDDPLVETFEPGMISQLPPGKTVTFGVPPPATLDGLPERTLRRVAASMGITYEELSGDWSKVNFSSARMARLAHWANVHHWQQNILIPQLCGPVWDWAMEALELSGALGMVSELPAAEWTPPPMPMLEPDKEGLAYSRLIRNGIMSLSAALREQGLDPETHLREIATDNELLDKLKIILDSDPRYTTGQGQQQKDAVPMPEEAARDLAPEVMPLVHLMARALAEKGVRK